MTAIALRPKPGFGKSMVLGLLFIILAMAAFAAGSRILATRSADVTIVPCRTCGGKCACPKLSGSFTCGCPR